MSGIMAVFKKEITITFSSPIFYAATFIFLVISGYFFYTNAIIYTIRSFQAGQNPFLAERLNLSDFVVKPFFGDIAIVADDTRAFREPGILHPGSPGYPVIWDGNPEIYTMNQNGGAATRLTSNPTQDLAPAISANGWITFISDRDGNLEVYIIPTQGGAA